MMQNNDNISYEDYLELVRQEVSVRTGKRVQLQTIRKNNGLVLDGLSILAEDTNVSPTIYLSGYYKEFLTDGIDAVAERVIAIYEENRELLETVPYVQILDLAVVFMVVLETEDEYQFGTILVHNGFLDYWKIEVDSLYKIAKENMRNDFQTIPMENIITAVMDEALVEETIKEMKHS